MILEGAVRADYLQATRPLVEATVGRRLRLAEHHVDVFALTGALDGAKDLVEAAIRAEQARAVRRALRTGHPLVLTLTRPMLEPLERLWRTGQREARAELAAAGITPRPRRRLEAEPKIPELGEVVARLKSRLNGFSVRLQIKHEEQLVELGVATAGPVADAIAKALIGVLGARGIAAGLVSPALLGGMGQTFEENQDLVGAWEYSSVLDGGTCDECAPLDGTTYATWDDIQEVLPNGGPNPACLGEDRCRCRAVPAA